MNEKEEIFSDENLVTSRRMLGDFLLGTLGVTVAAFGADAIARGNYKEGTLGAVVGSICSLASVKDIIGISASAEEVELSGPQD